MKRNSTKKFFEEPFPPKNLSKKFEIIPKNDRFGFLQPNFPKNNKKWINNKTPQRQQIFQKTTKSNIFVSTHFRKRWLLWVFLDFMMISFWIENIEKRVVFEMDIDDFLLLEIIMKICIDRDEETCMYNVI